MALLAPNIRYNESKRYAHSCTWSKDPDHLHNWGTIFFRYKKYHALFTVFRCPLHLRGLSKYFLIVSQSGMTKSSRLLFLLNRLLISSLDSNEICSGVKSDSRARIRKRSMLERETPVFSANLRTPSPDILSCRRKPHSWRLANTVLT